MKNKVHISIDGKPFTLVGTESAEYITDVAEYVNKKIAYIRESDKNSFLTRDLAVILTCVNLADELFKEREKNKGVDLEENVSLKKTISLLEKEIEGLIDYKCRLSDELDIARRTLDCEKDDKSENKAEAGNLMGSESGLKLSKINEGVEKLLDITQNMEDELKGLKSVESIRSIDRRRRYRAEAYLKEKDS